jgi:hypothetical protein
MKKSKLRYSLSALLFCLTTAGVLCTYFMLSDIGFEFHAPTIARNDNDMMSLVKYGYCVDKLNLRKSRLEYVLIGIAPKPQSISLKMRYSNEAGTHTLRVDEAPFEVPQGVQLVQVDQGQLRMFQETVTLEQWLDYSDSQEGILRIEDLLDFCSDPENTRN